MPKTKDALIRYRVINRCLVEKKFVTKKQLKEACERAMDVYPLGDRTIDSDIHAMRYDPRLGYNAPIKNDRRSSTYYYDDPNYSIDNIPLNEEELNSIVFASKLLEQFKGVDIFRTFAGSVQKLVDAVNIIKLGNENSSTDYIEFENVIEAKGSEFIDPILGALNNKTVLSLEYRTFTSDETKKHIVHPYLLKEYRNRWFLNGFHDEHKSIATFGLDRIVSLTEKPEMKFTDNGFNAKEYYKNVIGISFSDSVSVEIHIAFTAFQAQYIITQPLHHSQELVSEGKDKIVFRYFLVPNYEFYTQALGWGDQAEIVKPEYIRNIVKEKIENIRKLYS